jgi:hypothetical protein
LDQFYEDPANASISIQAALILFHQRVSGATPNDIAAKVTEARRFAASEKATKEK